MKRRPLFTSLPSVLLRIAGLSIDVLDNHRAAVVSYRLDQYTLRKAAWSSHRDTLLAELFTVVESLTPGKLQQRLQQLRRDLHNERPIHERDLAIILSALPSITADRLHSYIHEGVRLSQYLVATNRIYRHHALQARRAFQKSINEPTFQRGLAMSSLSLLRQINTYQRTDPANFRKDDYQLENGLLRYFTRTATKTTPYSTLAQLAISSTNKASFSRVDEYPSAVRSHVRLSVRLLGVFDALISTNKRLREQKQVTLNPSITVIDNCVQYVRQHHQQVACVRIPINPAIRWILSVRPAIGTYFDWSNRIRLRFKVTGVHARQYIDKLIELGLFQQIAPVSAADSTWPAQLRHWLIEQRWQAPVFGERLIQTLDALQQTAYTIADASAQQRTVLLQKAHQLISEHVSTLQQAPSVDFWPLRAEQLFFEDTICSIPSHPGTNDTSLLHLAERVTTHVNRSIRTSQNPLVTLFKAVYSSTDTVSITSFFETYLRQEMAIQDRYTIPTEWQERWEHWARRGLHKNTVSLQSAWIPDDGPGQIASGGVFWQTWINQRGQSCAVLNSEADGFGRMYGRFLPYFDSSVTAAITELNQKVAGNTLLVEPTDDHYHNANFHPSLLAGIILTPEGHLPTHARHNQSIRLSELTVQLSDTGEHLQLWHRPTQRQVSVLDMGFQSIRSTLYNFLCLFGAGRQAALGSLCTTINRWYAREHPQTEGTILPRITLDSRLIIQRRTWQLAVGPGTALPVHDDAFAFFRSVRAWQLTYGLPDEVFVSLSDSANADDRKPQYIRFDNPLLVDLLRRLVRKSGTYNRLRVVEMRPHSGELLHLDHRPFVIEAVPQWYQTGGNDVTVQFLSSAHPVDQANPSVVFS